MKNNKIQEVLKNEKAKENLKENLKNKKSRNLTNCFL